MDDQLAILCDYPGSEGGTFEFGDDDDDDAYGSDFIVTLDLVASLFVVGLSLVGLGTIGVLLRKAARSN